MGTASPPPRRPYLRLLPTTRARTPCPVRRIGPTQIGHPINLELQQGTAISPTRTPQQGRRL